MSQESNPKFLSYVVTLQKKKGLILNTIKNRKPVLQNKFNPNSFSPHEKSQTGTLNEIYLPLGLCPKSDQNTYMSTHVTDDCKIDQMWRRTNMTRKIIACRNVCIEAEGRFGSTISVWAFFLWDENEFGVNRVMEIFLWD